MFKHRASIAPVISNLLTVICRLFVGAFALLICSASGLGQLSPGTGQAVNDSPPDHPAPFVLHYTGALFGYYRIDNPRTPIDEVLGPVTMAFGQQMFGSGSGGTTQVSLAERDEPLIASRPLLVGMGDNFGPEFGASIQMAEEHLAAENRVPHNATLGVVSAESDPGVSRVSKEFLHCLFGEGRRRIATNADDPLLIYRRSFLSRP